MLENVSAKNELFFFTWQFLHPPPYRLNISARDFSSVQPHRGIRRELPQIPSPLAASGSPRRSAPTLDAIAIGDQRAALLYQWSRPSSCFSTVPSRRPRTPRRAPTTPWSIRLRQCGGCYRRFSAVWATGSTQPPTTSSAAMVDRY